MHKLEIFDPAMCCSTGVCGPSVDPKLVKLAADVAFLKSLGIDVVRYNLGQNPGPFVENQLVTQEMGEEAQHLPIYLANGELKAKGVYPARKELASWFGLEANVAEQKPCVSLNVL